MYASGTGSRLAALYGAWVDALGAHYHSVAHLEPYTLHVAAVGSGEQLESLLLADSTPSADASSHPKKSRLARMQAALEFARSRWAQYILVRLLEHMNSLKVLARGTLYSWNRVVMHMYLKLFYR